MRLYNEAIDFTAVHTLVLLDIFLCFRQLVLLRLILFFNLAKFLLFDLLSVLILKESIDHHIILTTLHVLSVVYFLSGSETLARLMSFWIYEQRVGH